MNLQTFFEWLGNSALATFMTASNWRFAVAQSLHLVMLAVFLGSALIVDLRLLGFGFTQQPVRQVARDAQPWMIAGLVGLLATGILQLVVLASKEYNSPMFWVKMEALFLAVLFTITVRYKITRANEARVGPVWGKVVGLVSIALWMSVAIPARLIGIY
jgi:hypothetical protein